MIGYFYNEACKFFWWENFEGLIQSHEDDSDNLFATKPKNMEHLGPWFEKIAHSKQMYLRGIFFNNF